MSTNVFTVATEQAGCTLAALVRQQVPGLSWNQARRLIETSRVRISEQLCLDPARRLQESEVVEILDRAATRVRREPLVIRSVDADFVVVEKPAGISTVRHPLERSWSAPKSRKPLA